MAAEKWDAAWTITATSDDEVFIEMDVTRSGYNAKCPGYFPRLPPIALYGTISATSLSVTGHGGRQKPGSTNPWGDFNFTTDGIVGTHDYKLCDVISCERTYSGANQFKLQRQR